MAGIMQCSSCAGELVEWNAGAETVAAFGSFCAKPSTLQGLGRRVGGAGYWCSGFEWEALESLNSFGIPFL